VYKTSLVDGKSKTDMGIERISDHEELVEKKALEREKALDEGMGPVRFHGKKKKIRERRVAGIANANAEKNGN